MTAAEYGSPSGVSSEGIKKAFLTNIFYFIIFSLFPVLFVVQLLLVLVSNTKYSYMAVIYVSYLTLAYSCICTNAHVFIECTYLLLHTIFKNSKILKNMSLNKRIPLKRSFQPFGKKIKAHHWDLPALIIVLVSIRPGQKIVLEILFRKYVIFVTVTWLQRKRIVGNFQTKMNVRLRGQFHG